MKANLDDATHWQQKHDEYWLLSDGVYYLFNEGHWQRAKPDRGPVAHVSLITPAQCRGFLWQAASGNGGRVS